MTPEELVKCIRTNYSIAELFGSHDCIISLEGDNIVIEIGYIEGSKDCQRYVVSKQVDLTSPTIVDSLIANTMRLNEINRQIQAIKIKRAKIALADKTAQTHKESIITSFVNAFNSEVMCPPEQLSEVGEILKKNLEKFLQKQKNIVDTQLNEVDKEEELLIPRKKEIEQKLIALGAILSN